MVMSYDSTRDRAVIFQQPPRCLNHRSRPPVSLKMMSFSIQSFPLPFDPGLVRFRWSRQSSLGRFCNSTLLEAFHAHEMFIYMCKPFSERQLGRKASPGNGCLHRRSSVARGHSNAPGNTQLSTCSLWSSEIFGGN